MDRGYPPVPSPPTTRLHADCVASAAKDIPAREAEISETFGLVIY